MKTERLILIPFLGNYLINNVVAALAALFPASQTGGLLTLQYIVFVVFALVASVIFAWWYLRYVHMELLKAGVIFGVVGFLVSVATTFISGLAGVVLQTGSLAQAASVLPRFGPFLWNWSTLVVLGYWVIPAVLVGWYLHIKMSKAPAPMM